uniref:Retrotransposon gag domain-containing protein n=1 Tax=Amphimedon queenslandica TaxID=400682 RepID=A0A1X7VWV7_AMPQE
MFQTRKDRALATVILLIDPSLLYLVGEPDDPLEVWRLLSNHFQKKTWANRLAFRRKLHSLRLEKGQSVQEHIKSMTEVFSELSVIGDNISDKNRVVYLLASLPESFDMLVTAFEANSDVPNLERVIEKLRHEERKQTERKAVNETEEGLTAKHKARRGPKCLTSL